MRYTRKILIGICRDAVVHHEKWQNRDSYSSQVLVQSIYKGLTSGLKYKITDDTDDRTIWIYFDEPKNHDFLNKGEYLEISSLEDYFKDCDPNYESEMFTGYGIDFFGNYRGGYLPTRKRLEETGIGNDWY